jgi:hypothetical protein
MKAKEICFDEQGIICSTYITHMCKESENINYKKTSFTWAQEVGKWSGVVIHPNAFDIACKKYDISRKEISPGVACYKLITI